MVKRTYLETEQTTNMVPLMFFDVKVLRKGIYCIIWLCQQTSKVQLMYLEFKNLKINSKIGQQLLEN